MLLPAAALADGTPALTMKVTQPADVLYGTDVPITLTAADPAGQPPGFNLTYRDVLPAGVTYVPGSSSAGDPTIITDPTTGAQTLIWSNVGDLSAGSSNSLSFKVDPSNAAFDVGGAAPGTAPSLTDTAQAYANTDPRYIPKFNSDGTPNGPSATSFTGETPATPTTTTVQAITIDKTGPATLLRGVHDHQGVYDLTVTNNSVNPTDTVTVDDWLPADLEFLGCGGPGVDNTTDAAGTNPGSPDEYPGSGPIDVAPVSNCIQPTTVETVDTTPPGTDADGKPLPAGVYTHVVWTIGNLTPGQVVTIPYTAAVPIRENTTDWSAAPGGTAPGTTGAQGVNLDNNTGPETYHNEPIVNSSQATGDYQDPADAGASIPTSSTSVLSGVAKDIVESKTVSPKQLAQGEISTYTLTINTSEYRSYTGLTVTDTLPNGQCPLDATQNFEHQQSAECGPTGDKPSSEYASAVEQVGSGGTGDGTYDLSWNQSTDPDLAQIPVNGTAVITFPVRTLRYYQQNGADDTNTPVLSNDSIQNTTTVSGTDHVRCAGGSNPEDCTNGTQISHDQTTSNGTTDQTVGSAGASASQAAPGPSIEKEVAKALPADGKCADATYQTTIATYEPGDTVCWLLMVNFPQGTDTQVSTLNDFLPDGVDVIPASSAPGPGDTVPFSETDATSAPQVSFTPCPAGSGSTACGGPVGDVGPGGQTLAITFASTEGPPAGHPSGDVSGNLMKFASENTAGTTFPLRSAADFQLSVPSLGLTKTIASVNSTSQPAGTQNATAAGGDTVTFVLAVDNGGTADATNATVWDELPQGESCADVVSSPNDTCVAASGSVPDHLVFTGVDVKAGATQTLNFQVTIPTGSREPSPGQVFTDTAGVTSYQSTSNTGTPENYYPDSNLNPANVPLENAPVANDTASTTAPGAGVTKTGSSTIHEVSTSDATIGEPIAYTVTTNLPAKTTLYGSATLTDTLPATLALDAPVTGTLNGTPLPSNGITLTSSGNTITVDFPATYPVSAGGDTLVLNFDGTVLDTSANARTDTIANTATLAWQDANGTPDALSSTADTTVVEPNLKVSKTDNATSHLVSPGQNVRFTVTASNAAATDLSPAHDVKVVDTVPAGVTVLNTNNPPTPAVTGDTVSTDGGGGIYDATANTITWSDIGTLSTTAPGNSQALHYNVTVNADPASGQTLTNTVTDTTQSLPAGTAGDRTSSSATNTGYTATNHDTLTVSGPQIAKTATPTSAEIGQPVAYQATVTLPANTVFHDLTILDTLPSGLVFDAYGSTSCSSGCSPQSEGSTVNGNGTTSLGWFVGELGPFATAQTITVDYTAHIGSAIANVDGTTLTNSATVQTDQSQKVSTAPTSPPAASSFQNHYGPATAPVKVIEPKLGVDKEVVVNGSGTPSHTATAQPQDTLTYSVTVSNSGDAPAYNVKVSDTPPAGLTTVTPVQGAADVTTAWTAGGPIGWTVPGPIAAGGSVTFTYTATVADGVTDQELLSNTASVPAYQSVPTGSPNGRVYTNDPTSTDKVTVDAPQLTITKVATSPTATAGSGDSYTIVVGNSGHGAAHAVTVNDTIPAGMNYAAGSATAAADASFNETADTSGAGGTTDLTWALGAIPAGGSVTITVPVTFPANTPDPTKLTNTATAQAPNAPNQPTDSAPITVHAAADLEAIKSVATSPIPAGGQDTYTLSVKNLGPSDAQSVTLTDPLPSSETFVSADPGCTNNAGTVTCQAGTVAAGDTATFHVTVSVDPSVQGPISNTLTVASPTPDPNPANNQATIAPDSISQADLSVTKTADKTQYDGGDTITYTITAHNAGPATAENVVVTDPLPDSVVFDSADPDCSNHGGTVSCTVSSLAVGATQTFTVKAIAKGTPPPAATPGTGDELVPVNKVEQQVTLTAGQTTTADLSCNGGYISDGDAKVIEVDQGTGTLASVEILKSVAISPDTYEFTLENTATGNAQVQLFAVCLPSTTTADQNGNTHPLIVGSPVTQTETLSEGDHTITVDVGNADVPIAPSFQFLNGVGTVQGSEGSSDSSVWTYTIDVTTPSATVEVASTPLQVQPGAAGGFTNDLEFTSVSQPVTVQPGQSQGTTDSVICPNGYEGIEATYNLPDGLLLLGDDPEPITRVFLLDNTTNAPLTGTVDLLCLADRTGPEVDYLGPVLNTATGSETNIDPISANNSGTAAIRIDRAVGSGDVVPVLPAAVAPSTPAVGGAPGSPSSGSPSPASGSGSPAGSGAGTKAVTVPKTVTPAVAPAPVIVSNSLTIGTRKASITLKCAAATACSGTISLAVPDGKGGVTLATSRYKLAARSSQTVVLHLKQGAQRTLATSPAKKLSLTVTPSHGHAKVTKVARPHLKR